MLLIGLYLVIYGKPMLYNFVVKMYLWEHSCIYYAKIWYLFGYIYVAIGVYSCIIVFIAA